MASTDITPRNHVLRNSVTLIFYLSALMLLLDVATTAIGLWMGGYETNVVSATIIHYYGLAGFELVKIPGVMIFVGLAVLVCVKWNKMHPIGRQAFIAIACFGLFLTSAPVANNLLQILARS